MPHNTPRYYPKAGRCRGCVKLHADCKSLPFHTMPVHRRDGADITVICTEYRPVPVAAQHRGPA